MAFCYFCMEAYPPTDGEYDGHKFHNTCLETRKLQAKPKEEKDRATPAVIPMTDVPQVRPIGPLVSEGVGRDAVQEMRHAKHGLFLPYDSFKGSEGEE